MSAPEWRGIVVKKYRALLDGSNLYRRLKIRSADGTTTRVSVSRDFWKSVTPGDTVSKAPQQDPVKNEQH
jgi:hypothetical protein